jgi:predicted Zn finger-like uncharacterized protein
MIIQCPSCKSRFNLGSSKINGLSAKGRCSVCGNVFSLLDHAVDVVEASALRDRLEDERVARIKEMMEQQEARQREAEEKAAAEALSGASNASETEGLLELPDIPAAEEVSFETEEPDLEAPEETAGKLGAEEEGTGKDITTVNELSDQPLQEEEEELAGLDEPAAEKETAQDSGDPESVGVPLSELGDIKPPGKRSALMPVLLIVLLLVVLGGGGWYLYNSGQSDVFNGIVEKIKGLTGQTSLTLFNLKNEQEPALDGKFFAVRGMVQSKRDKAIRFVPLRIKIFNGRNKTILTGQTVAGKVLSAEKISKMSVQDVLKKHRAFIKLNKKTKGVLGAGKKLPFVFLFDLSRFPRRLAKSFQIEVVESVK